jgi:colanic acid biosynthesis glycosyl transferase WcaI
MRVLILTQFFPPEVGAAQTRLHTFASGLAARGHTVEVICEIPNHPQGVIHPGWEGRPLRRRAGDGFTAQHVWVYTRKEKTTKKRLLFYGTFAALATIVGCARPRPDIVFASSPPLPVAAAAALIARRHRVPWVFDVRDLWPKAAVAIGELSNLRMVRWAERFEQTVYEDAAAITVTTEPFRALIAARVGAPNKVLLIPNGTTRLWVEGAQLEVSRSELGLDDGPFLLTFAGHIGAAQGLEAAVDAAALLGDDFQLLLLGDGPARAALERRARSLRTGRILFRDQVEPELAVRYLRASDALLVSLAAHPTLASFVPSKLFDCCAVGRAVIVAADGESQRLAATAGAALGVPAGDARALADAVRRLRDDADLRDRIATAGQALGAANLRDRQVDRLSMLLEVVVTDAYGRQHGLARA